jgi:hypothetical protein
MAGSLAEVFENLVEVYSYQNAPCGNFNDRAKG